MNLKEYGKIEEEYGAGSEEAKEAYRDLMITDLKPLTAKVDLDEWGDAVITLKDSFELSGEELIHWITFFEMAEGAHCRFRDNKIKIDVW